MMKMSDFQGIHENAFAHRLKRREYPGALKDEIVIETWYRLSFEEAKCFIEDKDEWLARKFEQGQTLPGAWIKLVTYEYTNTVTGKIRGSRSTSLRPYVQGYGCDGSTDLNIHAIANRLAERHGLDYPALMIRAYPADFSEATDFSWLNDEDVLAETIIPEEIDADLALKDLQDINNYTLAEEFGIELYNLGVITTNWPQIRETREFAVQQIERDVYDWWKKQ